MQGSTRFLFPQPRSRAACSTFNAELDLRRQCPVQLAFRTFDRHGAAVGNIKLYFFRQLESVYFRFATFRPPYQTKASNSPPIFSF